MGNVGNCWRWLWKARLNGKWNAFIEEKAKKKKKKRIITWVHHHSKIKPMYCERSFYDIDLIESIITGSRRGLKINMKYDKNNPLAFTILLTVAPAD